MLAEKTGATGVQRNAAIPEEAPEIDYWAITAGEGARLDGKQPAPLKDSAGNVVDIRQLRAEAAQRRAAALEAQKNLPASGLTLAGGEAVVTDTAQQNSAAASSSVVTSKRKNRIGSKYSKLKSSASKFTGSANNL
jgi:hypothetical protein